MTYEYYFEQPMQMIERNLHGKLEKPTSVRRSR